MSRFATRLLLTLTLLCPSIVLAHEFTVADVFIDHPWIAPPPPGAPSVAGYVSITNKGDTDDRLLSAVADFADTVQMHETRIKDDVVGMHALPEGIPVPAGQTITLAPGGMHLMFVAPDALVEGDAPPVTLTFETAGTIEVQFKVEIPEEGAAGSGDEDTDMEPMDHSTMDHGEMK